MLFFVSFFAIVSALAPEKEAPDTKFLDKFLRLLLMLPFLMASAHD